MERLNFVLKLDDKSFGLELDTMIAGKRFYEISKNIEDAWPVKFFTATTPMCDFIGNVLYIIDNVAIVLGIYQGMPREVKNVIIQDKNIVSSNRVMVTEHINVDGKMELIATKKRVLISGNGSGLNFMCVGWSNKQQSEYLRIDPYLGDFKIMKQNQPCFAAIGV